MVQTIILAVKATHANPINLTNILQIVQILFFILTGSLAFFSYLAAKRTFFQPLRTEVFKKQVEGLAGVLELTAGKGETSLRSYFGLHQLININIVSMYDAYARWAFGLERAEEKIDQERELVSGLRIPHDRMRPGSGEYTLDIAPVDISDRSAGWHYVHRAIEITKRYVTAENHFREILDNPLLPSSIASLVEQYFETIDENVSMLPAMIDACATEMPSRYPTEESLRNSSYTWVHNKINHELKELEPIAQQINSAVRSYFDSDNLLPEKKSREAEWYNLKARFGKRSRT